MVFLSNFYYFVLMIFAFSGVFYLLNGFDFSIEERNIGDISSSLISSIVLWVPYCFWMVIGLLTSQWYLFLTLIFFTFLMYLGANAIQNEIVSIILERGSVLVEVILLIFISLNHFHFGLNLLETVL